MAKEAKKAEKAKEAEKAEDTVTIEFKSFAGVSLMLLVLACVFYIPGFGGTSWGISYSDVGSSQVGLWQSCTCTKLTSDALKGKLRPVDTRCAHNGIERGLT